MATESATSNLRNVASELVNEIGEICSAGSIKELKKTDVVLKENYVDPNGGTKEIGHQVDAQTENPGSSKVESEVSHQEEERDLTSENRTEFTDNVVDSIHEAADFAREAAVSCERTVNEFASANEVCRQLEDSAAKLTEAAAMHRASYYDFKQRKCKRVTKKVNDATGEAENAADLARASADNAEIRANDLLEALNTGSSPEVLRTKSESAGAAERTAKAEAANAYQKKYLFLLAVKECWDLADSMANDCTSADIWTCSKKKLLIILGIIVILAVLAVSFMYLPLLGFILLIPTLGFGVYQIVEFIDRQRKARKRRETMRKINGELCDLQHYCERKNIQLDSQEEMSTRL